MSTIVGRAKIDHPSLGAAGGSALHTAIETIYTNVSNHLSGRWYAYSAIADSTTSTFEHNFGAAFSDYNVALYTGTHPSLTRVPDPAGSGWTIAATSGFEKTKIDITTPSSGGPHTFAIVVAHVPPPTKYNNLFTTTPGATIAHGLGVQPLFFSVLHNENADGKYVVVPASSYQLSADATNIYTAGFDSLLIDGTHQLRILASVE